MGESTIQQLFNSTGSIGRFNFDDTFPQIILLHTCDSGGRWTQTSLVASYYLFQAYRKCQRYAAHSHYLLTLKVKAYNARKGRIAKRFTLLQLLPGKIVVAMLP